MTGKTTPQPFSDNFWSDSALNSIPIKNFHSFSKKNQDLLSKDFLDSIDESPEFHDPFSDLTLFLYEKIKETTKDLHVSKWSVKIQEHLIEKISPEFQKKYPHYRLSVSALRKCWEKIQSYSQMIQSQKECIKDDGKLNTHFFIKENLKHYLELKDSSNLHPYHYAHQLAVKMSEWIAVIDGVKPKLEDLTKIIWSTQKHLLCGKTSQQLKSPYDEYDKTDKLIVRTILGITAKDPTISQSELEYQTKEVLASFQDVPVFSSLDKLSCNVSALLAQKLYPSLNLDSLFLREGKNAILSFIRRQTDLCKTTVPAPSLVDLVKRILGLYALASQLPKTLSDEEIAAAVKATYPNSLDEKPALPQSLYAFISAELMLLKHDEYCHSIEYVTQAIWMAYKEAESLPKMGLENREMIEIVTWKILSEMEGFLEKLPYSLGQKIEEEIANILIDNPKQSFSTVVYSTVQFFKKIKELSLSKKWNEIERKIHIWTIQGDMVCRSIRLDSESPLFKFICQQATVLAKEKRTIAHHDFINTICLSYLKDHPELAPYIPQLILRISVLYKYTWYNSMNLQEESSFERFVKWHQNQLQFSTAKIEAHHFQEQLEMLIDKTLPLVPIQTTLFFKQ